MLNCTHKIINETRNNSYFEAYINVEVNRLFKRIKCKIKI